MAKNTLKFKKLGGFSHGSKQAEKLMIKTLVLFP